ncbi:MAG: hypothetical protein M5U13_11270 [Thermoanaerobaculia bacterium]|nr:hypothetical protein [Thermoanaerobaculia bacterium]
MGRERAGEREGGLPDPGAALDRLERAIEARLPAPPRPVWAGLLVFVLRLLLGRGSWVLGALLVALSAPWFVLPYRQVETMVRAAWYREGAVPRRCQGPSPTREGARDLPRPAMRAFLRPDLRRAERVHGILENRPIRSANLFRAS